MIEKGIYEIISTGSDGNAILYFDKLLVDVGIPYKDIEKHLKKVSFIFISHKHTDHLNKGTLKRISQNYPLIRYLVGEYLVDELEKLEIPKHRIVIIKPNSKYRLNNALFISPFKLYHNVENMGLKAFYNDIKLIHATDTYTLEGIEAKNYDYYMIEANFDEKVVEEKSKRLKELNMFDYSSISTRNHLSKQEAENWIGKNNLNGKGKFVRLHQSDTYI